MTAPNSWLQVEFELGQGSLAAVELALQAVGALSIEYKNAGAEAILEPVPGTTPLWQAVRIAALLDPQTNSTVVRKAIAAAVAPVPPPELRFRRIEDRNWVGQWQESLRPLRFGERLWVCPADQASPDPDATTIVLEPGLGFGTGTHPTTALCLEWLAAQPLQDRTLLDYGCGSGILAIAGLVLGARTASGVDIDPQALEASKANAKRNSCLDRLDLYPPAALPANRRFDVVLANILCDPLVALSPVLMGRARPGTQVALSGILTTQAPVIRNAYRAWLKLDCAVTREEWILLAGTVGPLT